jgi:hypothetical protein
MVRHLVFDGERDLFSSREQGGGGSAAQDAAVPTSSSGRAPERSTLGRELSVGVGTDGFTQEKAGCRRMIGLRIYRGLTVIFDELGS